MKKLSVASGLLFAVIFNSITAFAEPAEVPLLVGEDWEVGTVHIWNDETHLFVQFELDEAVAADGWCITGTKLHIGQDLLDFPLTRKGHPKLGHFDFKTDHNCVEVTDPMEIELADLHSADSLLIAAKAEVELGSMKQGAWTQGIRFTERGNRATYFEYLMHSIEPGPCCDLLLRLFSPLSPTPFNYTITVCGESVIDAFGSSSEILSDVLYDAGASSLSFTATYPDGSIWQPLFTLGEGGMLNTAEPLLLGTWEWVGDCND